LEEYDFFDEMCLVALDISKEVRFAAVTDTNGKLIAGKQRKDGISITVESKLDFFNYLLQKQKSIGNTV
jgi:hypothetical protein